MSFLKPDISSGINKTQDLRPLPQRNSTSILKPDNSFANDDGDNQSNRRNQGADHGNEDLSSTLETKKNTRRDTNVSVGFGFGDRDDTDDASVGFGFGDIEAQSLSTVSPKSRSESKRRDTGATVGFGFDDEIDM